MLKSQIYLLGVVLDFAIDAHKGQRDKGGFPYILHPIRVMESVNSIIDKCVALLHDVVEDTDVDENSLFTFLLKYTDSETALIIVNAVLALSKEDGEDYDDYIERVKSDPISVRVKIADLTDNMRIMRIPDPGKRDFDRVGKYAKTLHHLTTFAVRNGLLSDS